MNKLIVGFFVALFFAANLLGKTEVSELLFKVVNLRGGPIDQEKIIQNIKKGDRESGPLTSYWYMENRKAQITDVKPIIRDNKLYGWNIYWVKKSGPTYVSVPYLQTENPFTIPENTSIEDVMKQMWKGVSRKLTFYKCKPVALNMVTKDGVATVHGLWYMMDTQSELTFRNGRSHASFAIPNNDIRGFYARAEFAANLNLPVPAPFKEFVVQKPNYGEVVVMEPFKQSVAQWIRIRPYIKDGKISEMHIADVMEGSPVHRAGVKTGTILKSIQGIEVMGLTLAEFDAKMSASPMGREFVLEVFDKPGGESRLIKIPLHSGDVVGDVGP